MPKLGMEPLRRQQVINATKECIFSDGMAKASLQRIARRAGITSGLILHYFDGKEGLFEAVYRDLYQRLADETKSRSTHAKTPLEKLFALLDAQVCDAMVEPKTVATWFAICAKASESPILARMERINSKRLFSNLVYILKQSGLSRAEARDIAEELLAMIYGLWSNLANHAISDPEQARVILFRFIRARIPELEGIRLRKA